MPVHRYTARSLTEEFELAATQVAVQSDADTRPVSADLNIIKKLALRAARSVEVMLVSFWPDAPHPMQRVNILVVPVVTQSGTKGYAVLESTWTRTLLTSYNPITKEYYCKVTEASLAVQPRFEMVAIHSDAESLLAYVQDLDPFHYRFLGKHSTAPNCPSGPCSPSPILNCGPYNAALFTAQGACWPQADCKLKLVDRGPRLTL
tara:strand:- start:1404 stop:2018 length:615 start_codon:yes stop_codon:yes gene_type:complete